jgi:hypothetical protein
MVARCDLDQAERIEKHAAFAPASQSLLGFRLRSPLLWRGTVPAPPSNGFLNTQPDLFLESTLALSITKNKDVYNCYPRFDFPTGICYFFSSGI